MGTVTGFSAKVALSGKNGDCHRLFVAWSTHPPRPATTGQGNRPKPRDPCRTKSVGGISCLEPPKLGSPFSLPFSVWGTHMNGYSENDTGAEVALTPVRPRSVCEVRLRGLPGSASFRRLRNRSARLQPPRHPAWRPGTGRMPALRFSSVSLA